MATLGSCRNTLALTLLIVFCAYFVPIVIEKPPAPSMASPQFSASYPNSLQHSDLATTKNFHGTTVVDKFAWLEDPHSPDVQTWVDAQNALTDSYLQQLDYRSKITARMTELFNYEKLSCPFKEGKHYYYFRNSGLQNQSVLYTQDTLKGEPRVFFDVNTLSEDGTTAIATSAFSKCGDYFAFGLSKKGSDWVEIQLKTVEESHTMASKIGETLSWVKFSSIQWTLDSKGFFYSRFPKPATLGEGQSAGSETESNLHHAIYYHRIGTKQEDDWLICRTPDHPKWTMGATVSDEGDYVFVTLHEGAFPANLVWYSRTKDILQQAETHKRDASQPEPTFIKLINDFESDYDYITNDGAIMYFKTNDKAPRYRIVSISMENPEKPNWKDVIAESSKDVLSWAAVVDQDKLIVVHIRDVADVMALYRLPDGKHLRDMELATLGTVVSISARKEQKEFFYKFSSFLHPGSIYHYNFEEKDESKQLSDFGHTKIPGYDASQFETHRLFCTSKDGVSKIPVFVVHKKGLKLDGSNPTLLYGYGGFNIAIQPYFSSFNVVWMQSMGGVFAVANIRGGAEYGEEWHKAGIKEKKQNVFDDFQSAAEYLIAQKYTQPSKLAIFGGSNGGLLVGACINQRPELYGAAIAAVGVMDMLNFHRYTIGHAWTTDYGCADNAEDFPYLYKYSPLHNVNASAIYPSTLLTTADHDDRVVPLHSYKYIAALQTALPNNPNPLIIKVDTKSGHSAGKPTSKVIEEKADMYTFLALTLKIAWQS